MRAGVPEILGPHRQPVLGPPGALTFTITGDAVKGGEPMAKGKSMRKEKKKPKKK
jgi:hypothetical protein